MSSPAPRQQANTENGQHKTAHASTVVSDEVFDLRSSVVAQRRRQRLADSSAQTGRLQTLESKTLGMAGNAAGIATLQCKKIAELRSTKDDDQKKSIIAALVALSNPEPTQIEDSLDGQGALEQLNFADWQNYEIKEEIFDVIDAFLQRSPDHYLPKSAEMWRSFIARIAPSTEKPKVLDVIDQSILSTDEGVENFRSNILAVADDKLKTERKHEKAFNLDDVAKLVRQIMTAHISINFALDKLFQYRMPRILNAFEVQALLGKKTNNIGGELENQRLRAEQHHFGILPEIEPRLRPRYAAINYKSHPTGAAARNDYGLSYMVLSDAIRARCTITIGDSFDAIGSAVDGAFPYTTEGVTKLAETILGSFQEKDFVNGKVDYSSGDQYLDVQIHTDVDIRKHVEEIYVSTLEMELFKLDIDTVDSLIAKLTGGIFVREA